MSTRCASFGCFNPATYFTFLMPPVCQMCHEKRTAASAAANSSSMPELERFPPPAYTPSFGPPAARDSPPFSFGPPAPAPVFTMGTAKKSVRKSKRVAAKVKAKKEEVKKEENAPAAAAAQPSLRAPVPSSDTQLAVMQARYEELSSSNARYDQLVQTFLSALSVETPAKKRKLR